jgi:hypothetical protein
MIIGSQKCGTSTLFYLLDNHPSLIGCDDKEPYFFSASNDWRSDINKYHALFKEKEGALYFEASTTYTFYPLGNLHIWDDIYDYNPNMKFIYIVRNPIDRIVSSYMHSYERGYTELNIEEALIQERIFIELTRYYTQISPYIKKFGRNNILIIDFEDLIHQREVVLEKISKFLSIDARKFRSANQTHFNISIGGKKKHHKFDSPSLPLKLIRKFLPPLWDKITDNSERGFSEKPVLSIEFKKMIINMLELEIRELQKLMKKDLGKWMLVEK